MSGVPEPHTLSYLTLWRQLFLFNVLVVVLVEMKTPRDYTGFSRCQGFFSNKRSRMMACAGIAYMSLPFLLVMAFRILGFPLRGVRWISDTIGWENARQFKIGPLIVSRAEIIRALSFCVMCDTALLALYYAWGANLDWIHTVLGLWFWFWYFASLPQFLVVVSVWFAGVRAWNAHHQSPQALPLANVQWQH